MATTLICVATVGTAATFSLKNGEVIEGEVVQATRNTVVIREKLGGIRQLSRRQMESMRVKTTKGKTITGPMFSWQDGVYEIESGGRLLQVRDRRIIGAVPIPPKQTIAEAASQPAASEVTSESVASEPSTSEPETSETVASETVAPEPAVSEPATSEIVASEPVAAEPGTSETASAQAEVVTPPSEPLSSASTAIEIETPPAKPDEPVSSEADDTAPTKSAELTNSAAVETETTSPAPADPEALAHSDGDPPPRLSVSAVQAGENASELVFKLDLSRPVDRPIMILYATYDKTAIAGEDYKGERGTISLAPGTSSAVVRIPLIDDNVTEDNETLELFVATDERLATIDTDRIIGTILNDDN